MTLELYLKIYTWILLGGLYTIFVMACLVLGGYYALKWVQVGMRLINRYFERRMRSGQIAKKFKKAKAAVRKAITFEVKKPELKRAVEK